EGTLDYLKIVDLEREVRVGGVDPVERLRLLDEMDVGAADVVPGARHAELGSRGAPEPEQPLIELARAGEGPDPHRGVVRPRDSHVRHVTSTSSTRSVRAGPIPNHDPIQAIQYFPARSARTRASTPGSVMTRAVPRTRRPSISSVTSGVFTAFRTQSRRASS